MNIDPLKPYVHFKEIFQLKYLKLKYLIFRDHMDSRDLFSSGF